MPRKSSKLTQRNVVPRDIHGWIDAEKYKPPKSLYFELLMIKDDTGRIQQGWWSGTTWDHIKRSISSNFVAWRLLNSDERVIKYKDSGKD